MKSSERQALLEQIKKLENVVDMAQDVSMTCTCLLHDDDTPTIDMLALRKALNEWKKTKEKYTGKV